MQVHLGDDHAESYGDDYPLSLRRPDEKVMPVAVIPTPKPTPSTTREVICWTPIIGIKTTTKSTKRTKTSTKRTSPTASRTTTHTTCVWPFRTTARPQTQSTHPKHLIAKKSIEALELASHLLFHGPANESRKSSTKLHGSENRTLTSVKTTAPHHIWHARKHAESSSHGTTRMLKTMFPYQKTTKPRAVGGCVLATTRKQRRVEAQRGEPRANSADAP